MSPPMALLVGIFVVMFIVVVIVARRRKRERTEALRLVAETAGLAFEPQADLEAVQARGDVRLFTRGHSRRVTNLMTGRIGDQEVAVFDYRYTTGGGKYQHSSVQTVVMLPSLKGALPDLEMAPESPLYRIAEVFGYQDINIESSPEFSRHYIVRGADEAAIRAVLYPRATSYFAEHLGWTVEVRSGTVAIYRANSRPKPDDLQAFIAEAYTAAQSL